MAVKTPAEPNGPHVRGGSAEAFDSSLDYQKSEGGSAELSDREEFRGLVGSFAVLMTRDDQSARELMQRFGSWRSRIKERAKDWAERRRTKNQTANSGPQGQPIQRTPPFEAGIDTFPVHQPQHQSAAEQVEHLPAATRVWQERGLYRSQNAAEPHAAPEELIDEEMAAVMGIAAARVREQLAASETQTAGFRRIPTQATSPEQIQPRHTNSSVPPAAVDKHTADV